MGVLSQGGGVVAHGAIAQAPIAPAVVGDFDFDGYVDVTLTGRTRWGGGVVWCPVFVPSIFTIFLSRPSLSS
jgi:hypothetical protein